MGQWDDEGLKTETISVVEYGKELARKSDYGFISVASLNDFKAVVAYARQLERENATLAAGSCLHVRGDERGNSTCELKDRLGELLRSES
jgi:hypothetical protein